LTTPSNRNSSSFTKDPETQPQIHADKRRCPSKFSNDPFHLKAGLPKVLLTFIAAPMTFLEIWFSL
jgi:hypothetical protein